MRLIDADALQKALAERWYEAPIKLTGIKVSMLIDEQPTIVPSLVGAEMSLPQYLDDGDIVKHENDMVTMNYNTYQDLFEPKRGHWHITDAYPHNVYCSECYTRFAQTHWAVWEEGSLPRKFCPNCGARME